MRYQNIQAGDVLVITCGGERLEKTVQQVLHFDSVEALFEHFPYRDVMPYSESEEEAKKVYRGYPGYEQKIASHGLLALLLA